MQVSDVWNISPSVINEARMGYTWAISDYPDYALGKGYAAKVGWQFAKADQFPSIGFPGGYYRGSARQATRTTNSMTSIRRMS